MCLGSLVPYCARQKHKVEEYEVDSHRMILYKEMINDYQRAGVPITPQLQKEAFIISRERAFEEKAGFLMKSIDDVNNARTQLVETTLEYLCSDKVSDNERNQINEPIGKVTSKGDLISFLEKSKKDIQDNDSKESFLRVLNTLQETANNELPEFGTYEGINKSITESIQTHEENNDSSDNDGE